MTPQYATQDHNRGEQQQKQLRGGIFIASPAQSSTISNIARALAFTRLSYCHT